MVCNSGTGLLSCPGILDINKVSACVHVPEKNILSQYISLSILLAIFPGGPVSPFWMLLDLMVVKVELKIDVQSSSHIITTNKHTTFYRPDNLPAVSKH